MLALAAAAAQGYCQGGHRQDAAAWPGGEVDAYLDTVVQQVSSSSSFSSSTS
ncbi:hypothetical protein HaLaN_17880 [Haematococcus lacustris]|uniref:Uncharacterized protein n=1 Tax=Haematococcus lacustris TaxID=44745 RepID=A0A699ZDM8_HAELA|nr:hypothetical protein HaLaN_17880 [Haematococcus lacustris]